MPGRHVHSGEKRGGFGLRKFPFSGWRRHGISEALRARRPLAVEWQWTPDLRAGKLALTGKERSGAPEAARGDKREARRLLPCGQLVKIIGPPLHHSAAFRKV